MGLTGSPQVDGRGNHLVIRHHQTILYLLCLALISASTALATETAQYGGPYSYWPTTWIPLPGLNDPDDGVNEHLDFVGDASDPGAYYQWDSDYFYFRMRMDIGSLSGDAYGDTLFILIDLPGTGTTGRPDYGFAWDTKSTPGTEHGMELMVPNPLNQGTTWDTTKMNDADDNNAKKISPPDFGLANGDAYLRTIDNVATTNFGTTTLVDWAISFDHLKDPIASGGADTALRLGQTWYLQLGSLEDANDHNFIDTDIAGGDSPTSAVVGSMDTGVTTPEPASMALTLLALGIVGGAVRRRKAKADDASDPAA